MESLTAVSLKPPRKQRWIAVVGWALGGLMVIGAVFVAYMVHLSRSYDVTETAALAGGGAKPLFIPLFRYNLYALHPTPAELDELNHTAGAMVVFMIHDKAEREKLLSHLIAAGLDINAHDDRWPSSFTALHMAVSSSPEDVELLLAHGARVDITDAHGQTPLDRALALQKRYPSPEEGKTVRLLQEAARQQASK